jgi:D-alanine-D-alanine ligase
MTRIGFAYNQKPEAAVGLVSDAESAQGDEDPPSKRRDHSSRTTSAPASPFLSRDASGARVAAAALLSLDPAQDIYAEWDSPATIDAVASALSACGDVIRLEADEDFPARLRAARPDIVFNIAEGLHGTNREAHVPAICEFFGIPYSGSDPFTLSLCLDKARTKELLAFNRIPTAAFTLIRNDADLRSAPTPTPDAPLFIKPVHEGSSKGITERNLVRSRAELVDGVHFLLTTYEQPVLVEAFLPGAEFTCGVLGNGADAQVLPIVASDFSSLPGGALPIYGFEAKWLWDSAADPLEIFECPARIDAATEAAVRDVVFRTYQLLGCRDWARVDVRLDAAGVPNVVEVNPLPGILPDPADNSCLPKAARAAGIGYDELIQRCLLHAADRTGVAIEIPTGAAA